MRHVYECPMRWADLDLLGHVNNVVFVDYLQEARVDMLRTHAPDTRTDDLAEGVVVVRTSVTYLMPLPFRFRPVLIDCWITEIKAATFTIGYELYDESADPGGERTVYARAGTVLTPYVFATEKPRRLTPAERQVLATLAEPGPVVSPPDRADVPRTADGHYAVHVRFSDVDAYRHVNNVKYFEFLQEGRIQLLERLLGRLSGGVQSLSTVVAQTEVEYRQPILHRAEPYDCWTTVADVGRTSMRLRSEIVDGDALLARASVVLVFVDAATERKAEPPAAYRDLLRAALEPAG